MSWRLPDGILTSKEKVSRKLDQFRPISLFNVEGKIFFGVIAKRMTKFMINKRYVHTTIQKAGIPGFPGCIEDTTMLWDRIKTAKNNESTKLHVIWLDLESTYGQDTTYLRKQWSSFRFQTMNENCPSQTYFHWMRVCSKKLYVEV